MNNTKTISGFQIPERMKHFKRTLDMILTLKNNGFTKEEVKDRVKTTSPYATELSEEEAVLSMLKILDTSAFKKLSNKTMAHLSNTLQSPKTTKRMIHSFRASILLKQYCLANRTKC